MAFPSVLTKHVTIVLYIIIANSVLFANGQAKYTSKETAALTEFRNAVQKHLVRDFQKGDAYLLRFLKTHNFNMEKAVKSLEKVHAWRTENEIDKVLDEDLSSHSKSLPYIIDGFDKKGNPILRFYTGRWLLRKYSLSGKRDIMIKVYRQMHENIFQKIWTTRSKTGQDVDQSYIMADLVGFNNKEQLCLGCLTILLQFAADYDNGYSVFARNTTLVNTPRIVLPALGLIKQLWTGSIVLKTFNIYDNNIEAFSRELLKDIAADQLPRALGGTKSIKL